MAAVLILVTGLPATHPMISSILALLRCVQYDCSASPSFFQRPLRSLKSPLGCALSLSLSLSLSPSLSLTLIHSLSVSVCRCRSLSRYSPRRANRDCTNCIISDVLLTRLVANVRGARVLDVVRVGVVAPTAPAQRAALVQLYIATNGSTWSDRAGWQNYATGSDPCDNSWSGVGCSGSSGSGNRNV
jgi:hypothetical protein